MPSTVLDTNLEPFLKVMQQFFLFHLANFNFLTNEKFYLFDCVYLFAYTLDLICPPRNKLKINKLGEHGRQETSPNQYITWPGNIHRRTSIVPLAMWAVAASCWNTFLSCLPDVFEVLDAGNGLKC